MNIKFLTSIAVLTLFLASCKKDYVCQCSVNIPGFGSFTTGTEVINDTKKKAKEKCKEIENQPAEVSGTPIPIDQLNATCTIIND